jgi:guanylate kinase
MPRNGSLFIVSGPSGAGKSALAASVLELVAGLKFSISYTTRSPRGSERNGVEYHFVTRPEFESLIERDAFLEWAEVYGNLYGTSKSSIDDLLHAGQDVLLDVDVQGAENIRRRRPEATSIFILPPSFQVLRERLERRKLDKEYIIEQRLRIACQEIGHYRDYDYLIINHDLHGSTEEFRTIIEAARCRMAVRSEDAQSILSTFGGSNADDPGRHRI